MKYNKLMRPIGLLIIGSLSVTTTWALDRMHQIRVDFGYERMQEDRSHSSKIRELRDKIDFARSDQRCIALYTDRALKVHGYIDQSKFENIVRGCFKVNKNPKARRQIG